MNALVDGEEPRIIQLLPADGWLMVQRPPIKTWQPTGYFYTHERLIAFALVEHVDDGGKWQSVMGVVRDWGQASVLVTSDELVHVTEAGCEAAGMSAADQCSHWEQVIPAQETVAS